MSIRFILSIRQYHPNEEYSTLIPNCTTWDYSNSNGIDWFIRNTNLSCIRVNRFQRHVIIHRKIYKWVVSDFMSSHPPARLSEPCWMCNKTTLFTAHKQQWSQHYGQPSNNIRHAAICYALAHWSPSSSFRIPIGRASGSIVWLLRAPELPFMGENGVVEKFASMFWVHHIVPQIPQTHTFAGESFARIVIQQLLSRMRCVRSAEQASIPRSSKKMKIELLNGICLISALAACQQSHIDCEQAADGRLYE